VNNNEVIIVDEFTGRLMPGRRWSEGLHQVVEARENRIFHQPVRVAEETRRSRRSRSRTTSASTASSRAWTGTADTEAAEFNKTYKMDVVTIPTNRPMRRVNQEDLVYRNRAREVRRGGRR